MLFYIYKIREVCSIRYDSKVSYSPFQTYDWLKSEEDNLYLESLKTGEIYVEKYSDSTGDWIYAIGPIKDSSGAITAVIEIGKNFYAFNVENRAVRRIVYN
jgi:hypothetical protein